MVIAVLLSFYKLEQLAENIGPGSESAMVCQRNLLSPRGTGLAFFSGIHIDDDVRYKRFTELLRLAIKATAKIRTSAPRP